MALYKSVYYWVILLLLLCQLRILGVISHAIKVINASWGQWKKSDKFAVMGAKADLAIFSFSENNCSHDIFVAVQ